MAIKNVVQRGTNVYAYDGEGNKLFNKPGALRKSPWNPKKAPQ
ncbi:hypothetical protein [Helicobacter bizzozeronii]|nr:hypothetical protein [Helicobacter bizzozeronii]